MHQLPARTLAISRAATIVGGLAELAQRLKITERQLDYWMRDIGTLPDTVFFDIIGIIIESAGTRAPDQAPDHAPDQASAPDRPRPIA